MQQEKEGWQILPFFWGKLLLYLRSSSICSDLRNCLITWQLKTLFKSVLGKLLSFQL